MRTTCQRQISSPLLVVEFFQLPMHVLICQFNSKYLPLLSDEFWNGTFGAFNRTARLNAMLRDLVSQIYRWTVPCAETATRRRQIVTLLRWWDILIFDSFEWVARCGGHFAMQANLFHLLLPELLLVIFGQSRQEYLIRFHGSEEACTCRPRAQLLQIVQICSALACCWLDGRHCKILLCRIHCGLTAHKHRLVLLKAICWL